ncbi:MAG: hypothetical protein IT548_06005 [Alphaproteobacteria bacterium]|nr:hypothetical protein [Alphaproteobacteria bacterium]
MRDFIINIFEGLAWLVFLLVIAGMSFVGFQAARQDRIPLEPWAGAGAGFLVGLVAATVVLGLIFTLLDMRASLDRLTQIAEDRNRAPL